ncbi:MAG TPA: hypothetical protein VNQ81_14815 [Povalibacter sp.]|nr:hypothetical protein [Povalibacter sp.]
MRKITNRLRALSSLDGREVVFLTAAALIAACALLSPAAHAASGLCQTGSRCSLSPIAASADSEKRLADFIATLQVSNAGDTTRRNTLSSQEYHSFSGVGAVICSVNGKRRMATAFLVGAFDIGVTVAHTFEDDGVWTAPENCVYTSTDSLGQIRERIPISYIKTQWEAEAGAFGQPSKDLAVIRLSEPSHYAQRTMPLGKFSGAAAPVLMVGFRTDLESDSLKSKSRGTVYERKGKGMPLSSLTGFIHDMDARGIAAGAPVIDERTGVIIGIHTLGSPIGSDRLVTKRNTMITMNEWLEHTLLSEMQATAKMEATAKEEQVPKAPAL